MKFLRDKAHCKHESYTKEEIDAMLEKKMDVTEVYEKKDYALVKKEYIFDGTESEDFQLGLQFLFPNEWFKLDAIFTYSSNVTDRVNIFNTSEDLSGILDNNTVIKLFQDDTEYLCKVVEVTSTTVKLFANNPGLDSGGTITNITYSPLTEEGFNLENTRIIEARYTIYNGNATEGYRRNTTYILPHHREPVASDGTTFIISNAYIDLRPGRYNGIGDISDISVEIMMATPMDAGNKLEVELLLMKVE